MGSSGPKPFDLGIELVHCVPGHSWSQLERHLTDQTNTVDFEKYFRAPSLSHVRTNEADDGPVGPAQPRAPLRQWVWRAFAQTTFTPLLTLQLMLVACFALMGWLQFIDQRDRLMERSRAELAQLVELDTGYVEERLKVAEALVQVLRRAAARALMTPRTPTEAELAALRQEPNGVFATRHDYGGAAVFVSGAVPVDPAQIDTVHRSAALDPLLAQIVVDNELVVQAYLATRASLCRVYPYFDVHARLPAGMVVPDYNFFYEADAEHNPTRGIVWTKPYLDPAGQGWIVSVVAPVYLEDTLVAVAGLDITLEKIIKHVLALSIPWGGYPTLIADNGTAIALPPGGEMDWAVRELGTHTYARRIDESILKPEDFNLFARPHLAELAAAMDEPSGVAQVRIGTERVAAWGTVQSTGWKLLAVSKLDALLADVEARLSQTIQAGVAMLAVVGLFYGVISLWLYQRSRRASAALVGPLVRIDSLVEQIGLGFYRQQPSGVAIEELDRTERNVIEMGRRLGEQVGVLQQARSELEQAKQHAEAGSRAKTHFIANLSHEFRTPLNGVLGMAEQLSDTNLSEEQRDMASTLVGSARGLISLVDDLLDFSSLDRGALRIRPEPINVCHWVNETLEILSATAQAKGLHLRRAIHASDELWVEADGRRLRQILLHLVENGIKFTERGNVAVEVSHLGSTLRLAVTDTGPGIHPSRLNNVFEVFSLGDESFTRRHGGLGLGLALCQGLCQRMGGAIGAENHPRGGAHFWVSIPAPVASLNGSTQLAPPRPMPGALAVLVAEDNVVNQRVVRRYLEKLGHQVEIAENGHVAMSAVRRRPYDLVLMDIQMPEMDGLEATRAIRALEVPWSNLPIVALTAHATDADLCTARAAGMDDYLTKPIRSEELELALSNLGSRRPRPTERRS